MKGSWRTPGKRGFYLRRVGVRRSIASRLFCAIFVWAAAVSGPAHADSLTYKNARFGTSVTFPAEIFREAMEPPPRGEGMTFLSGDGASLAVFAMNNALDVTPEELADQSASGEGTNREVTYRRVAGNWVVLSGLEDGKIFYKRFEFGDNEIIHGLLLRYPLPHRETYDTLVEEIGASFDGP